MFPIYPGFTYGGSMSILHSYILHLIRIQGLVVNQEVDTNNDIFVILLQITRQSSKCSVVYIAFFIGKLFCSFKTRLSVYKSNF
jgi:hypothetical protein